MTKNKGSFWKNNIKKIKKERKERSNEQEAQKKEARIWAEAKKKKEEIVRKEEETKRIREAKEEAERKEIQRREKEQVPEIWKHELLLDTNIIVDVFTNNKHVITKLKNYEGGNNLLFLLSERIIREFINMWKHDEGESVQYDKVIEKLSLLGEIKEVEFNWNSQLAREGKEIERSEKYANKKTGVPLSETDCFLLQHAIEHSYILVTDDRTLINATIDSGGDVFNPREL